MRESPKKSYFAILRDLPETQPGAQSSVFATSKTDLCELAIS
jgi:hypothetical protein